MQILVHRQGQQLGPFTREQLRAALAAGTIGAQDLAWWEGAPAWTAVASVPGLAAQPAGASAGDGSTLAVWSLVLGLLSFFGCMFFAGIPGVICGHMAVARKNRAGVSAGKGFAIFGLVASYAGTVMTPFVVAVLASIAIPVFGAAQDKAKATQSVSNERQIAIALIAYANEHDDAYPANLQELVGKELPDDSVLIDPMAPEFGKDGYDYIVPDKNDDDDKVVLVSRGHTKRGERSVAHKDGSVKREKYAPKPDL